MSNPMHIYFDMSTVNSGLGESDHLVFKDDRTMPVIDDTSQYYVSVVRFNLSTANSLPLWIPKIDISSNNDLGNINKTIYSFSLRHKKKITYSEITTTFTITPSVNGTLSFMSNGVRYDNQLPFGLYGTSNLLSALNSNMTIPVVLDRYNSEPANIASYTRVSHTDVNVIRGVNDKIKIIYANPYNNPFKQSFTHTFIVPSRRYKDAKDIADTMRMWYPADQTITGPGGFFSPHFPLYMETITATNRTRINVDYPGGATFTDPSTRYISVDFTTPDSIGPDLGFERVVGLWLANWETSEYPNRIFEDDFTSNAMVIEQLPNQHIQITALQNITIIPTELLYLLGGAPRPMENINMAKDNTVELSELPNYEAGYTIKDAQAYVYFQPTNMNAVAPTFSSNLESLQHEEYYSVYSFNDIRDMLNDALSRAFNILKVQSPTLYSSAPYFEYDVGERKFILNAEASYYNSKNDDEHIEIYCNTPLFTTLLCSFPHKYYGHSVDRGFCYQFKMETDINDTNITNIIYSNTTVNLIQLFQEYTCGGLCSPISSIVFQSQLIPILPCLTGLPYLMNDSNQSRLGSSIIPIITDFQTENDDGYGYAGYLHYSPGSEYRLIDMMGNSELNSIQVSVYWKDNYGNLHPFKLKSGMSCHVKFMFRHRNFNG